MLCYCIMSADRSYAEPRTGRAVLGDKTTNGKARINQTTNGKNTVVREADKSQANRPRTLPPKTESSKLQILLDNPDPLNEEVDTNPPPPPGLPYKSDIFPKGALTFDTIKPENRLKGYYDYYHNRRDENGMTRLDREMKAMQEKRFMEADAKIWKEMNDTDWGLGLDPPNAKIAVAASTSDDTDKTVVRPGGTTKIPSTLNSRRAASALGMISKPSTTNLQRKPLAAKPTSSKTGKLPSFMQPTKATQITTARPRIPPVTATTGIAVSRSTLGYTKGRSASSVIHAGHARTKSEVPSRGITRPNTTASGSSNATITPASYARSNTIPKPEFVSIFDLVPDEQANGTLDAQLFGSVDDDEMFGTNGSIELFATDEDEDDFRLELSP